MVCNPEEHDALTDRQVRTLTVLHEGTPIFTSLGQGLSPLFALEESRAEQPSQPEHLILQDNIIGKAAALLIHRWGYILSQRVS